MVQHYVEDIGKKHHVRLLSTSDVITPTGRTKSGVVWELSVKRLDAQRCELTNHVIGKTTPEYWESLGKEGIPFDSQRMLKTWRPRRITHRKRLCSLGA